MVLIAFYTEVRALCPNVEVSDAIPSFISEALNPYSPQCALTYVMASFVFIFCLLSVYMSS